MHELVEADNPSKRTGSGLPAILIGIFIALFLAIHPFKDGNGRLFRELTTLLPRAS